MKKNLFLAAAIVYTIAAILINIIIITIRMPINILICTSFLSLASMLGAVGYYTLWKEN